MTGDQSDRYPVHLLCAQWYTSALRRLFTLPFEQRNISAQLLRLPVGLELSRANWQRSMRVKNLHLSRGFACKLHIDSVEESSRSAPDSCLCRRQKLIRRPCPTSARIDSQLAPNTPPFFCCCPACPVRYHSRLPWSMAASSCLCIRTVCCRTDSEMLCVVELVWAVPSDQLSWSYDR